MLGAPLTFPCRCGETLYLWVSADGGQCLRAQHGENREHCIDLTLEGLPIAAVAVSSNRVFAGYPARGDPWIVDVGGWWIKAVHDRQGVEATAALDAGTVALDAACRDAATAFEQLVEALSIP